MTGEGNVRTRQWVDGDLVSDNRNSYPIEAYVPGAEPEVALEPIDEWTAWKAAGWQFLHGFFYTLIPQFDQWAEVHWEAVGLADSWTPTLYTGAGVASALILEASSSGQTVGPKLYVIAAFRAIVATAAVVQGVNHVAEGYVAIEQAETLGGALDGAAQIGVGLFEAGLAIPYLRAGRTLGVGALATVRPASVARAARGTVNSEAGALAAQLRAPLARGNAASGSLTGQIHHPISRTVFNALEQHPNLAGKYLPRDARLTTQAIDEAAHRGYQAWHRALDAEVAQWIRNNPQATSPQSSVRCAETPAETSARGMSRATRVA